MVAEVVSGVVNRVKVVAGIQVALVQLVEQAPAQHLKGKMVDLSLLVAP